MLRIVTASVAFVLGVSGIGLAADHPLDGAKLVLRRSTSGKEKLAFVAKDAAFLFPAAERRSDEAEQAVQGLQLASQRIVHVPGK